MLSIKFKNEKVFVEFSDFSFFAQLLKSNSLIYFGQRKCEGKFNLDQNSKLSLSLMHSAQKFVSHRMFGNLFGNLLRSFSKKPEKIGFFQSI